MIHRMAGEAFLLPESMPKNANICSLLKQLKQLKIVIVCQTTKRLKTAPKPTPSSFIVSVRELVLEDARSLTRCLPGPRADHGKGAAAFLFSPKTDRRRRRITRKHRT